MLIHRVCRSLEFQLGKFSELRHRSHATELQRNERPVVLIEHRAALLGMVNSPETALRWQPVVNVGRCCILACPGHPQALEAALLPPIAAFALGDFRVILAVSLARELSLSKPLRSTAEGLANHAVSSMASAFIILRRAGLAFHGCNDLGSHRPRRCCG